MNYISINSSQNVNINFNAASLFERIIAFVIDMFIKIVYIYSIFFVGESIEAYFQIKNSDNLYIILFLISTPAIFYTFVFETFMNGQTPGKLIMKIKVIKIDGFEGGAIDYFVRWMFRIVEIFAFGGVIAILSVAISKKSQRLGDMASGMGVISLRKSVGLNNTILTNLENDYKPTFSQVVILSDNDMRIIKENYEIARQNNNQTTLHSLSIKIQEVLKITNPYPSHSQFISVIIKDYNFYTQY